MRRYPVLLQLVFRFGLYLLRDWCETGAACTTRVHTPLWTRAHIWNNVLASDARVQIGYTCSINVAFDKKASLNRGFRCPFFEDMLDCVSIFSSSFVIIFLLFLGRGGKMFETLNLRKRDGLIVDWKILRKSVVTRFLRFFGGRKAGGIYHWP